MAAASIQNSRYTTYWHNIILCHWRPYAKIY